MKPKLKKPKPNSRKKRRARWLKVYNEVLSKIDTKSFPATPLHFAAARLILKERHNVSNT